MSAAVEKSSFRILGRNSASHDDLFRWILVMALVGLGALILWDYGFIRFVLLNDISRVSALILVLFALGSLYCVWSIFRLSHELGRLETYSATATADRSLRILRVADDLRAQRTNAPDASSDLLLQSAASEFRTPVRYGVFVADALYKLGLLGTVIGFILMLEPMRGLGDFDTETMRLALQQMTTGMAVALLTTVTGLVCGALLRLQFVLLESLVQRSVRALVRFSEVDLPAQEMKERQSGV